MCIKKSFIPYKIISAFYIIPSLSTHTISERKVSFMSEKNMKNVYDDGNIPQVDLSQDSTKDSGNAPNITEPLPESSRPRKDGPGGD